jgi:hypothetical protein
MPKRSLSSIIIFVLRILLLGRGHNIGDRVQRSKINPSPLFSIVSF